MNQGTSHPEQTFEPLAPEAYRSIVRSTFFLQCAGVLAYLIFTNGLLMLYLLALDVSESRVLLILALAQVTRALVLVPIAHVSDIAGIKRVGAPAHLVASAGLGLLIAAGFFREDAAFALALSGVVVFGVSWAMFDAGWFALLSGIISPEGRAKYFGSLRFTWMLTSICFAFISARVLGQNPPVWVYQAIIGFVIAMQMVRMYFYVTSLPERVPRAHDGQGMWSAVVEMLRLPNFAPFCAYVFLLVLFTSGGQALFALIEKTSLNLGDNTIVTLSTVSMIGQLVGFMLAGFIVHRLGTKPVFLMAHMGFACVMVLFPLRGLADGSQLWLGVLHAAYGVIASCSSVAITTELFSLIPARRRSLSAAIQLTLQGIGASLSTMIPAWCIKLGFFKESWAIAGGMVSAYDAVLLAFGFLTLMMTVSLTLVPSVIGRNEQG